MTLRSVSYLLLGFIGYLLFSMPLAAQAAVASSADGGDKLQLVVMFSRHGVRSPMTKPEQYSRYSAAPWPKWDVPPAYLTAHGYELMKLFGGWYRARFSGEGLFAAANCIDAAHVTIIADTDQRTRETGKALAEGMFPGCTITVHSQADNAIDPLFHSIDSGAVPPDPALAMATVAGRIGGNSKNLTEAYKPQLEALDRVLAGCGHVPASAKRMSIFDIPASLTPGSGDNLAVVRGPVVTGAALAGNLLLEYTEGMSDTDTGWGCLDGLTLRTIMQLGAYNWNYRRLTPAVAQPYASNLLDRIQKTMEQGVTGKPVKGALGRPDARLVILVGHDTNIAAVRRALDLDWIEDGLVNYAPPGGALLFELWHSAAEGKPYVRVVYTAQTLEQMRRTETLTPANPPAEAPIFIPGCRRKDLSCSWEDFSAAVRQTSYPPMFSRNPK